jgi:hypothetical protein
MKYMDGTPFLKKPKSVPAASSIAGANALKPEGMMRCHVSLFMFVFVDGKHIYRMPAL